MRDLLDALDAQLAAIAVAPGHAPTADGQAGAAQTMRPPRRRRRRRALAGTTFAAGGAAVAAIALAGTSTAGLPIFETPSVGSTALRSLLPAGTGPKAEIDSAHAFTTPGGPGYALRGEGESVGCLVVPDPGLPGSYGSACDGPLARIERNGLLLEQRVPGSPTTHITFLLPEDASHARIEPTMPQPTHTRVKRGILTGSVAGDGVITWRAGDLWRHIRFSGVKPRTSGAKVSCPNGELVSVGTLPPASTAAEARRAMRAARQKACG